MRIASLMRGGILVALAVVMAGCATPGPAGTLTAWDALAIAQADHPGLAVWSVRGLEGTRAGPGSDFLGLNPDGLPDGALGDGRLSSWAISFIDSDGLLEVQVFADSRVPVIRHHELPYAVLDEQQAVESVEAVDSSVIGAAVLAVPSFAGMDGVLYTFARTGADHADSGQDDPSGDPLDFLGWPAKPESWMVAGFQDGNITMETAEIDAAGQLQSSEAVVPRIRAVLAEESIELRDPVPPAPSTAAGFNFQVPAGAQEMQVYAWTTVIVEGEYRVRVSDPAGQLVYDSARDGPPGSFWATEPIPGTWNVTWSHDIPLPFESLGAVPHRRMAIDVRAHVPLLQ